MKKWGKYEKNRRKFEKMGGNMKKRAQKECRRTLAPSKDHVSFSEHEQLI